jgi:hypothetical protein
MLGIAQNPSTRIVFKGLLCLRAVILALLGALVFAGSAHAGAPVTETPREAAPVAPVTETPPEAAPVAPVTKTPPETAPVAPVTETPPEAAPVAPVTEEVASTVGGSVETPATSAVGPASIGAPVGMTAAQWAGDLSCELSALGGCTTNNCTDGWLGTQPVLSVSPMGFAAAAASLGAATPGAPAGGGHGGSAVGSSPVSPAPGPAPSGASGGSAAGASALSLPGFLTLAGLLHLAAPRAMHRLRLSCQPWLTACFVLIPERPG